MKHEILLVMTILLLLTVPAGAMSKKDESEVPRPLKAFDARVTDIDGVITEGRHVSINGKTYISAKNGSTSIFIPFERIRTIEITGNNEAITTEKSEVQAHIVLTDGSDATLMIRARDELAGETAFGSFRIRMNHVTRLELTPAKTPDAQEETSSR